MSFSVYETADRMWQAQTGGSHHVQTKVYDTDSSPELKYSLCTAPTEVVPFTR